MKYQIDDQVVVKDSPHQDLNGCIAQVIDVTSQGEGRSEEFDLYRLKFYFDPELRFSCVERFLKPLDYLEQFEKSVRLEDLKLS